MTIMLTSIRNLPSINTIFETGLGEVIWFILNGLGIIAFYFIQVLSLGLILYTVFLILIALKRPERDYELQAPQKKFLIFVPAHNEETVVAQIINNLLHEVHYPKELLDVYVIADNCTDSTAAIARKQGAKVIEHFSAADEPKGKPYGIKYALAEIGDELKKYDAVAIFDADNLISLEFFNEMNSQMLSDPNIMVSQGYLDAKNVDDSLVSLGYSLSYYNSNRFFCFARNKLNLSPVIGGTGFVMDRRVLEELGWTVNSLTEDLELQMQCALHGYRVVWNHFAPIYDEKPTGYKQSLIQRVRWARGHWTVNRRFFFPLIKKVIKRYITKGELDLIALDSALYSISPLANGAAPVILLIALFTAGMWQLIFMFIVSFLYIVGTIVLAQYAMRRDSRQRSVATIIEMFGGLVWYMMSGMCVSLYGILTYKQNVWVRTEHSAAREIQDILAISED